MSKSALAKDARDWNNYEDAAEVFGRGALGSLQTLKELTIPYSKAVAAVGDDADDKAEIATRQDEMVAAFKDETDTWSVADRVLFKILFQRVINNM